MRESVVITGIGLVCAAGAGREAFEQSLSKSVSGIKSGILEKEGEAFQLMLGAVSENDLPAAIEPRRHLNFKHMSRSGLMVCAAASMATRDAHYEPDDKAREQTGIVMGTAFGGIQSMLKFNADVRAKGPSAVNPIVFPDTVSNAPAGYAAISFGMMGMNATLSSGFASGLTAIRVAWEQVACGSLPAALAGGYDELIPSLCRYWRDSGIASPSHSDPATCPSPFHAKRDGFFAGEGAAVLLLERRSVALDRGAPIYAEIAGFGACPSNSDPNDGVSSRKLAMARALAESGITSAEVGAVFASANGSVEGDALEAAAIDGVLNTDIPVTAIKAYTGECMAASGPASVAAALWSLKKGCVPGIPGLTETAPEIKINVSRTCSPRKSGLYSVINAFGLDAGGESMVVRAAK